MATINQLRQERRAYFQELKRQLRPVDSAVEKMQRLNERILGRTRDVPETADWEQMVEELESLLQVLTQLERLLRAGEAIFFILSQ